MEEIIKVNKKTDSGLKVNELRGVKVLDNKGKKIGTVMGLRINSKSYVLDGVEVDRGVFGTDTFIETSYINLISLNGVTLNMTPVRDYRGFEVLDLNGIKVGKIEEIRTEGKSNDIAAIVVARGIGKNDAVFSKSDVKSFGKKIMLNKAYDADAVKVGGRTK